MAEPDADVPTTSPSKRAKRDDVLFSIIRAQPAVAIAFASAALVIARTLTVASFQLDVAVSIATGDGVAGLAIGTALAMAPYYAPLVAFVLQMVARHQHDEGRGVLGLASLAIAVWIFAILTTPFVLVVVLGVVALASELAIVRVRRAGKGPTPETQENSQILLVVFLFFVATSLTLTSTAWLPLERLAIAGQPDVVAYVLDQDGEWTKLLRDDDRQIMFIKQEAIQSRTQCVQPMARIPTLMELVGLTSGAELCSPDPFAATNGSDSRI